MRKLVVGDQSNWWFNLPLQIWNGGGDTDGDGLCGYRILNYMPRKDSTVWLDEIEMNDDDLRSYCNTAAEILENLARLFREYPDAAPDDDGCKAIYYPTDGLELAKEGQ